MSELEVDVVRRMFAAFAERDLDGMVALMDPEVDFLPVTANITTGGVPYRGPDGIRQYLDDVARVWPALRLFPEEIRDLGTVVVALGRVVARGGGMILDQPTGWVFSMRAGRILRARVYASHDEALAAAALVE